ncbi:hypothetical protein [Parasphingorhabdus pacifica]
MLDDIGSGFAKAQGALAEASKQTSWINEQVSSGQLRMNPEAAEAAAKHCEDSADEVGRMARDYNQIDRVRGLGDYESSVSLTHHFEQKANQSGSGAVDLLRDLQTEMLNQADAFRNAAKDYRATDEQIADDLGRGSQ